MARERQYLDRGRIHVDPFEADDFTDPYAIVVDARDSRPNVIAMELSNWHVPHSITPAFMPTIGNFQGNNLLDVRLTTYPVATQTVDHTYPLWQENYPTIEAFATGLETMLNIMQEQFPVAFWRDTNGWKWTVTPNTTGVLVNGTGFLNIDLQQSNTANSAEVEFLFATGPNRANSPRSVLGFEAVDAGGAQVIDTVLYTNPLPTKLPNPWIYPYVDVQIEPGQELQPLARIPTAGLQGRLWQHWVGYKPRILLDPPLRIQKLRIRVSGPLGVPLNPVKWDGYNLTIDALSLMSMPDSIPSWVRQSFVY